MPLVDLFLHNGVKPGIQQGYEDGVMLIAKKFLDLGLSSPAIATATGLTIEEIEKLRANKKI